MRLRIVPLVPFLLGLACAQQPPPQHDTIVVTGTYEPLSLDEIDRAIQVLPARENALMLNTLIDLLRLDPSLDLQERAPDGVQADLSIRGSSFEQTLVLLNGQRLNDVQSGHHDMDIPVPLQAVSRVEVMEGSGSTMYGSDASGGVINIVTEPPPGFDARLRLAGGSFGTNQQSASISDTFGPVAEQLSFARDFSSGFMPDRDYRNLQFASTTDAKTSLGSTDLTLGYMDHPFGADQFYGPYNSWEDTKTWFAGIRQQLDENTDIDFSFRRHSDDYVLLRYDPSVYTNHHVDHSYVADVRRRKQFKPTINLYYGVEALHENIFSNNLGIHARSRGAAYAAADFRALKRFSLTLSAREEIYRRYSAEFSPTAAGGFWINQHWKLRASASRSFRVPSYTDLYYSDPANQGNPNLRPERAWTYESGVDWSPVSRVRAALTVFERRERDGIDYYRSSLDGIWQALNIDNLNFTGVEASVHVSSIDFRYAFLHGAEDTIPIGETKYSFNYPVHSFVANWQRALPAGLLFRTRLGVLDRLARPTYPLWDLYAARSRGAVHPFLQVTNVTGTSYQEILGVQMPGRSIIGGVELALKK